MEDEVGPSRYPALPFPAKVETCPDIHTHIYLIYIFVWLDSLVYLIEDFF